MRIRGLSAICAFLTAVMVLVRPGPAVTAATNAAVKTIANANKALKQTVSTSTPPLIEPQLASSPSSTPSSSSSSNSSDATNLFSITTLLLGLDYIFYVWTFFLISIVTYLSFYKYYQYTQMQKKKKLTNNRQQQQQPPPPPQSQLSNVMGTIFRVINVIYTIVFCLLELLFTCIKNKIVSYIYGTTNANNLSANNANPALNKTNQTSSLFKSFTSISADSSSQDQLVCLNNCLKWFYFNGETTRNINTTILNNLNTLVSTVVTNSLISKPSSVSFIRFTASSLTLLLLSFPNGNFFF